MDGNLEFMKEICNAIAYYVTRQEIVLRIMVDLGLDPEKVGKWGPLTWEWGRTMKRNPKSLANSDLEKELREIVQKAQMRKVSQKGLQNQWQYYLHGNGCSIKHKKTGEPISWDCPNPKSFDPYAFVEHLEWRIHSNQRVDEIIKITDLFSVSKNLQFVLDVIFSMKKRKLITEDWMLADKVAHTLFDPDTSN